MPITVSLTLYHYHELEPAAKQKAKDWWIGCWDDNDNDQVTELFRQELEEAGYPTDDINWSLSYCQGDGMAFYTNSKDGGNLRRVWLRRVSRGWSREDRRTLYRLLQAYDFADCVWMKITRTSYGHRYSHYNTMVVDIEHEGFAGTPDDWDLLTSLKDKLTEDIQADVRSMSQSLALKGYKEIEGMQSEESVASAMEANNYTFTKDGKRHD